MRRGAAEWDTVLVKRLAHRVLVASMGGYQPCAAGVCVGSQSAGADGSRRSSSDGQIRYSSTSLVSLDGGAGSFWEYGRARWRSGS